MFEKSKSLVKILLINLSIFIDLYTLILAHCGGRGGGLIPPPKKEKKYFSKASWHRRNLIFLMDLGLGARDWEKAFLTWTRDSNIVDCQIYKGYFLQSKTDLPAPPAPSFWCLALPPRTPSSQRSAQTSHYSDHLWK